MFLVGSDNLYMANFGLREMPVERTEALKELHQRIVDYRNAPRAIAAAACFGWDGGRARALGYFYDPGLSG